MSWLFQEHFNKKKFPYDRRINRNNDPPFVNKIVVAFKMFRKCCYIYVHVHICLGYFRSISTTKKFPYDRRINRNNDPPFVNKIVVAFKMFRKCCYIYVHVHICLGYFRSISTTKKFPYDRRINRNNDPPFVNKIVVAFKMLGIVVLFIYIAIEKKV